jgi:hypothetical protein
MGVDCLGLLIRTAHKHGLSNYDTTDYSNRPKPEEFLRGFRDHLDRIPIPHDAGQGDVGIFRAPTAPVHCGIIEVDKYGQKWVIHSSLVRGKVVREPLEGQQLGRLVMAFKFREPA